jgi:hypothetical protein
LDPIQEGAIEVSGRWPVGKQVGWAPKELGFYSKDNGKPWKGFRGRATQADVSWKSLAPDWPQHPAVICKSWQSF